MRRADGLTDPARTIPAGRVTRSLLLSAGLILTGLGAVGAFLPILPTTPFLLLAAACFARSSEKFHRRLFENRLFGEALRRYRDGEGLTPAVKSVTLAGLWLSLAVSIRYATPENHAWLDGLLLLVGVAVTTHLLLIKTRRGPIGDARNPNDAEPAITQTDNPGYKVR